MFPKAKPRGNIKAIACLALRHIFQTQFFHEECMDVPL